MRSLKILLNAAMIAMALGGCDWNERAENRTQQHHGDEADHHHERDGTAHEARTTLSELTIESSGIKVEKAAGGKISQTLVLNGQIVPDTSKLVRLGARFPGVVKEVRKALGSRVEKGEVLATVEANESLRTYDLVAPRAGEVLDLNTSVGESVAGEEPLFTLADLSTIWVELSVPQSQFAKLKTGQKVIVRPATSRAKESYEGTLIYLSAIADRETQTRLARAEIANPTSALVPELFVEAKVIIEERQVPVAIKAQALQNVNGREVVFKKVGQTFEAAILQLGERDGDWIEVKDGLAAGAEYVTENSFVVKADIMKSGAEHTH